jgi:hypothetical protein
MGIKISELPSATNVSGTEEIPLVQSATTKKATASQLKGYRSFVGLVTWDVLNEETVLTTLQNDDFTISLTKTNTGEFTLEDTSGPFLQNKTFLIINQNNNVGGGGEGPIVNNYFYRNNDDILKIEVFDINTDTGSTIPNDLLNYVSIEVRVYP